MKKVKGLIIMLLISLSLFGMTACSGENGKASTYEQITAEQAKTIMDTEKDYVASITCAIISGIPSYIAARRQQNQIYTN